MNKVVTPYHLVIKYHTEEQRNHLSDMVLRLVRDFELTDFHIEEIQAFTEARILYNNHTLVVGDSFSYDTLRKKFKEFLKS